MIKTKFVDNGWRWFIICFTCAITLRGTVFLLFRCYFSTFLSLRLFLYIFTTTLLFGNRFFRAIKKEAGVTNVLNTLYNISEFTHTCLSSLLDFFEPSSLSVELALRLRALFVELTFLFFLEFSSSDELSEEVEEVESEEELDDDDEDAAAAALGGSGWGLV